MAAKREATLPKDGDWSTDLLTRRMGQEHVQRDPVLRLAQGLLPLLIVPFQDIQLAKFRAVSRDNLRIVQGYLPLVHELMTSNLKVSLHGTKLKSAGGSRRTAG